MNKADAVNRTQIWRPNWAITADSLEIRSRFGKVPNPNASIKSPPVKTLPDKKDKGNTL